MFQKVVKHKHFPLGIAIFICLIFFTAYSVLSIIRHLHYESFGYDLGINNQIVWRYSTFQPPITTVGPFPGSLKLDTHVELVYAFITPFYWLWSSARMLLLVEAGFLVSGAIAMYLLARDRKLSVPISLSILFSYLTFYGLQNAMWFDVHSASFGAAFIAWMLYFLNKNSLIGTLLFFLLAITAKENIAFITLSLGLVYFISRRNRLSLLIMIASAVYLFFIFFIYFPFIVQKSYLYANHAGLLSNFNLWDMVNTQEKRITIFYSLFSFGFLTLLNPLLLIPVLADLGTYFIIGSDLTGAHGLFMHYRVTLTPLLAWGAIGTIAKYKLLQNKYVAIYIVLVAVFIQYSLHLPLSYLTKSWFWTEPSGVPSIAKLRDSFTPQDAIVAQNNLIPHISKRDKIYTLYPEKKTFTTDSPCGEPECDWFRWYGNPEYLFVDTSPEWDIRHFLANRPEYVRGLANIEKAGIVTRYRTEGNAVIYKVLRNP